MLEVLALDRALQLVVRNVGGGKFEDVSAAWGLRTHLGKGMGGGLADYDLDGKPAGADREISP